MEKNPSERIKVFYDPQFPLQPYFIVLPEAEVSENKDECLISLIPYRIFTTAQIKICVLVMTHFT